ncbi:MAG: cytochrome c [Dehalococcoidia bacterium]
MTTSGKRTIWLAAAALIGVVVLAACEPGDPGRSTGSYPIDIFQEMHYNQSLKAQEPPRFLPPEDSYPVSGGFIAVGTGPDAPNFQDPPPSDATTIERASLVYKQNCSICHGLTAQGDGFVGIKFEEYGAPRPPSFDSPRIQGLTSGRAFSSISGGFGFMPAFQGLLTEKDRWALVALIEATTSQRTSALAEVNNLSEPERTLRLLELRGQLP